MPQEKKMRDRARVKIEIRVTHADVDSAFDSEIAAASISDEAVLERGDGSLLDNEYAFTGLLERVTREAVSKVESTLSDLWTYRDEEAQAERREVQLSEAQLFISRAPNPNERGQREKVLSEFLGTEPGELQSGN